LNAPPKFIPVLSRSELALVVVTMIWGSTFLVIHNVLAVSGPLFFVGSRYACAAVLTMLLSLRILRGLTRRELVAGVAIGLSLFAGYSLQTYGLQTISSSKSAFITALYVPLVPLFQWIILKRPPHVMSWMGIAFAFGGLTLLAGPEGSAIGLGRGEVLTIAAALAIALEIILISKFAGGVDVRRVTVVQLAVTALISFAAMPVAGEGIPEFTWLLALSAGGMGLASTLIQLIMNWAQQRVSPTRATLIYAGEPVWAGLIGRLAGERLPPLALFGGALIVMGVVVSEWRPKRKGHAAAPVETL
jgi:drug/metabolite transporter (DMT)-like permease